MPILTGWQFTFYRVSGDWYHVILILNAQEALLDINRDKRSDKLTGSYSQDFAFDYTGAHCLITHANVLTKAQKILSLQENTTEEQHSSALIRVKSRAFSNQQAFSHQDQCNQKHTQRKDW